MSQNLSKRLAAIALILIINHQAQAQDVVAVLKGPTKVDSAKQAVIIRTDGSKGDSFKFMLSPTVASSFTFKDESTGQLVYLFVPDTEGTYSLAFAATNKAGKLDLAILQITVGPPPAPPKPPVPVPPPVPPDELSRIIAPAYATDIAAGVATQDQRSALANLYRNAAKVTVFDKTLTKPGDVYNTMRLAAPKIGIPDGCLPQTRAAIAAYQKAHLNITAATILDDPTRASMATMFNRIATVLDGLISTTEMEDHSDAK